MCCLCIHQGTAESLRSRVTMSHLRRANCLQRSSLSHPLSHSQIPSPFLPLSLTNLGLDSRSWEISNSTLRFILCNTTISPKIWSKRRNPGRANASSEIRQIEYINLCICIVCIAGKKRNFKKINCISGQGTLHPFKIFNILKIYLHEISVLPPS